MAYSSTMSGRPSAMSGRPGQCKTSRLQRFTKFASLPVRGGALSCQRPHRGAPMKFAPHATILVTALLAGWSGMASATEYGTVVSSTPVLSQVPTGQRLCSDEQVQTAPRTSGAGAVAGALIGGAVGNQIGAGVGPAAAPGPGLLLGAGAPPRRPTARRPPST